MTTSTLQRQKAAFSTKLQHFKVMMARIGFAQVLIIAVHVISAKLYLLFIYRQLIEKLQYICSHMQA